ncbi:hypothetical protein J6590_001089 [Homalodisca vitripennis]|nr:hypothetical protein J6590_001089 [Homalodisca vitripennis]
MKQDRGWHDTVPVLPVRNTDAPVLVLYTLTNDLSHPGSTGQPPINPATLLSPLLASSVPRPSSSLSSSSSSCPVMINTPDYRATYRRIALQCFKRTVSDRILCVDDAAIPRGTVKGSTGVNDASLDTPDHFNASLPSLLKPFLHRFSPVARISSLSLI